MKLIIIPFCGFLFFNISLAQVDTTLTDTTKSVYKDLATRRFYAVSYFTRSSNGEPTIYEINDKVVSKSVYDKYHDTWKNMEECKPCILLCYDLNEVLLSKGIEYTDCRVGFRIEYYPNGQVKLIGHYKENPSGDWENLWENGFCSRKDGTFTYFSESGQRLYSEYWKDGQFIKQVPEQNKTEIWTIDLMLDSTKVDDRVLTPEQVSQIKFIPRYKNLSIAGTNITIEVIFSETGKKNISKIFTIDTFKEINVKKIIRESGIKFFKTKYCFDVYVFNNSSKECIYHQMMFVNPR